MEVYDALVAACRFGLPSTTRCKLCEEVFEGTLDRPPRLPLSDVPANACPACLAHLPVEALETRQCPTCGATAALSRVMSAVELGRFEYFLAAIDRFAAREGFDRRDEFLSSTFLTPDLITLYETLSLREPLEVLGDPFFARGHGQGTASETTRRPSLVRPQGPNANVEVAPPSAPPRAVLYPLVSVICADGEVHPNEVAVVNAFLHGEGLGPLTDDELRVHPPAHVAHLVPLERRRTLIQLMCEVAAADGVPDESERRVIRAYASAWDVPDDWLEAWLFGLDAMNSSLSRQLWMQIRRFVLSARWGDSS